MSTTRGQLPEEGPRPLSREQRHRLLGRGLWLEGLTIAWSLVEAGVGVTAGIAAHSIVLIAFGLDSVIEMIAGTALFARLHAEYHGASRADAAAREKRALYVVGTTLFLLGFYVVVQSASTLAGVRKPEASTVGIALAGASLVLMPLLAWAKQRTGLALESRALLADAQETLACALLALTLLVGLGLNAAAGWWWADPVAALVMVPWVLNEGREAIHDARQVGGE
ncbi:MAG: cation transporter [Gemmatimonadota bacterium]|jgi:divalent metal cation (Fe/Co/Zn/Cd) transporter